MVAKINGMRLFVDSVTPPVIVFSSLFIHTSLQSRVLGGPGEPAFTMVCINN
jgi:hypothetical protein